MAGKAKLHNPLILTLFAAGLAAETLITHAVAESLLLNTLAVVATAVYFYVIDDVAKAIKWMVTE